LASQLLGSSFVKTHKPSIAIFSDQRLFREGLIEILRAHGFHRVREFGSLRELTAAAHSEPPGILFLDLDHEREDTMTLVRSLRHDLLDTHIVLIGSPLRQGAAAGPTDDELETPEADAIALAAAARSRTRRSSPEVLRQHRLWSAITPRQRDVLRWMAVGACNRTIARKLRVGERAIKAHVSALLDAFSVDNRTQLALLADRAGLRPPGARARS
jgi:DNA-binding NarL/FixJ family response regulator